jgi:hypothetical protein
MVVQWTTRDVGRPVVRFGTTPGSTRPHGSSSSSAVSPAGGGRPPPPPPQQQQQQQQDAARHTGRSSSKQVRARSSTTYGRDDMCGPPANTVGWLEPGTFHAALLEGLLPGRRYFYAVGDEVRHGAALLCCCAAVLLCCCAAVLLCCCAAVLLCCRAAVLLCCCAAGAARPRGGAVGARWLFAVCC